MNQLHQFGDFGSFGHEDEGSVREKRLIHRGEGIAGRMSILAQMFLKECGIFPERGRKVFNPYAIRHRLKGGVFFGKKSIHKN